MPRVVRITYWAILGLLAASAERSVVVAQQVPPTASSITLLALNQPPCSVPSAHSIIKLKLSYHLAATEQSEFGFAVSIKFQGTNPRMTFSKGRGGQAAITARHDTLTLSYPMAAILADTRLRRPITCYLYLHRNTNDEGRSIVIAQTPAIVFQECL